MKCASAMDTTAPATDTSSAGYTGTSSAGDMNASHAAAACSAASAAAMSTAAAAAASMAAATAAATAAGQFYALGERALFAVFPVKCKKRRQAGVEDFLLTEKDFMRLGGRRCRSAG
jgi:hypothetical protein